MEVVHDRPLHLVEVGRVGQVMASSDTGGPMARTTSTSSSTLASIP